MENYKREHHRKIDIALHNFNADFLLDNHIIFGGGTRIAMEIDDYRESIDVDIICPDVPSYKAARSEITNISLGIDSDLFDIQLLQFFERSNL